MRISSLDGTAVSVPITVPTRMSTRDLKARDYLVVSISADDAQGVGYTYLGTTGAKLAHSLLHDLIAPRLVGRDLTDTGEWWEELYREFLLIGRRGLVLRVLSAIDIAVWDLRSRAAGVPLVEFLGGASSYSVPAYASGGYYRPGDPIENVRAELGRYQELGFRDFKIKVGGAALDEDVARVRAARDAIGDGARLALDTNNAWPTVGDAERFIERVTEFDPWWLEEPLSPDDLPGHRILTERSPIPIATGEIHATHWELGDIISSRACSIVQPDVGVVGGIGEWLAVAGTAKEFGIPVAPHWNANVHVHLVAAVDALCVEYFALEEGIFNFETLITERLQVRDGALLLPGSPGVGLDFDPEALSRYAV